MCPDLRHALRLHRSDGVWKRFVTNSLHYVCLRAWLAAGFDRSQFLVIRSEQLRVMTADELVSYPRRSPSSL
eukprot:scaffold254767_cov33-Tisochrysis_lutea.AAC.4